MTEAYELEPQIGYGGIRGWSVVLKKSCLSCEHEKRIFIVGFANKSDAEQHIKSLEK